MIFVYPAIVSNNVDKKIAPVVCRVIEQFFLSHLAEAFQSGSLRVKTVFDQQRDVYGPLTLENKKVFGKTFLSEATGQKAWDEQTIELISQADDIKRDYDELQRNLSPIISISDLVEMEKRRSSIERLNQEIVAMRNRIDSQLKDFHNHVDVGFGRPADARFKEREMRLTGYLTDLKTDKQKIADMLKSIPRSNEKSDERAQIEREKLAREKGKEKAGQYETHGSYKVETMKGVSLKPTMMNLSVKIHYVGGEHEKFGGTSPSGTMQEIAVGCKVLPMVLNSFEPIEDAILNDYFATAEQMKWRTYYRNFLRSSMGTVQKTVRWLTGKKIDMTKDMDPVNSQILMAPQGYIQASSFKHKGGSAEFYNYSSAIVMFNKDDIMREEGSNFFLDKYQLSKMFKAGWNSFCILDPLREEAMFISALDGGTLHIIPYSYIFNTTGMDQIYTNMNDLQRRSPVFRKSAGSFSSLVSRLKRESALLSMMKQFITEKKHGEQKSRV